MSAADGLKKVVSHEKVGSMKVWDDFESDILNFLGLSSLFLFDVCSTRLGVNFTNAAFSGAYPKSAKNTVKPSV